MARTKGARDWDYEDKRRALVQRLSAYLAQRQSPRPSLRELAKAAGVSLSTLNHYFGSRTGLLAAVLREERRRAGVEGPAGADLADSVRGFSLGLVGELSAAGAAGGGDLLAVGLAEGLLDPMIGRTALAQLIEPRLHALGACFDGHVARGDMVACDTRAAALMLYASLTMLVLHQDQLGGSEVAPFDRASAVETIAEAFLRAYCKGEAGRTWAEAA